MRLFLPLCLAACSAEPPPRVPAHTAPAERATERHANVVSVSATGEPGAYEFTVGVLSHDSGCDAYADWWEVVGEDGTLIFRRILEHSHPREQPFRRSGAPVAVQPDTVVWVRAHMAPGGYDGDVLRGTVAGGFTAADPPAGFAAGLETQAPLPTGCAF
jgi:hypothetical protein